MQAGCSHYIPEVQKRSDFGISHFQALRQGDEFDAGAVWLPGNPAILKDADNRARGAATEGLHPVARSKRGGFAEGLDGGDHRVAIEHASDVVGNGRGELAAADTWQIGKERIGKPAADISKSVSVEKKKRGRFVKISEKFPSFEKRRLG